MNHPMNLEVGLGGVYTAACGECGLDLRRASSLGSGSRVGGVVAKLENGYMDVSKNSGIPKSSICE